MAAHHLNFNLETVKMMRFQPGTFWSVDQFSVPIQCPQSFAESMNKHLQPSCSFPLNAPPTWLQGLSQGLGLWVFFSSHWNCSRANSHVAMIHPNSLVHDISRITLLSFWQAITSWTLFLPCAKQALGHTCPHKAANESWQVPVRGRMRTVIFFPYNKQ